MTQKISTKLVSFIGLIRGRKNADGNSFKDNAKDITKVCNSVSVPDKLFWQEIYLSNAFR